MNTTITVSGFEPNLEMEKYTKQKIMELQKRVPRSQRDGAVCALKFVQKRSKDMETKTCRVILEFGEEKFRAKETTQHMYTALDIAVADVARQLHAYRRRTRERELLSDDEDLVK